MGWENCHMYEFNIQNQRIGIPLDGMDDYFSRSKILDAEEVSLDSHITRARQKFVYEYDFGDGWLHEIKVEKSLPRESKTKYPVCMDGELRCPPEDCGGVGGYYDLLEILEDDEHPDYEEILEWIGDTFDPKYFDKSEVNKVLRRL